MATKTILANVNEFVSIDTETTGLDVNMCDLIEVAAVKVSNGRIVDTFESLIQPSTLPIDNFIVMLTGITNEELEEAPDSSEVIPQFQEFVGDLPIVGHNVCFDARFLAKELNAQNLGDLENNLIDTLRISRHVFKDMQGRQLPQLVKKCEDESGESYAGETGAHRALADAFAASFCYQKMTGPLVDLYGDDPEAGFKKQKYKQGSHYVIEYDGITPTVDEIDGSNPFFGSTVCFTGTPNGMTRREAIQHAVNLGATPIKSVTKKLDYLVVGSFEFTANLKGEKSSKMKKAEKYIAEGTGLKVVSDALFLSYT